MSSDEPYPHNGDVWWADPAFNCPDCLKSTAVECGCERGRELEATKRITSWEQMEDRHAEQDIIDRAADVAARAADRKAFYQRHEARTKPKAEAVDVERDHPGVADGVSYSLGDEEAVRVMKQMRLDAEAARRAHAPYADPDAGDC